MVQLLVELIFSLNTLLKSQLHQGQNLSIQSTYGAKKFTTIKTRHLLSYLPDFMFIAMILRPPLVAIAYGPLCFNTLLFLLNNKFELNN